MKTQCSVRRRYETRPILLGLLLAGVLPAAADVRLPKIFTDNMMLQRDQPIRVWGWAEPDEAVSVALADKHATTKADRRALRNA